MVFFKPIEKVDFLRTKFVRLKVEPLKEDEESTREWAKRIMSNFLRDKQITLDSEFAKGLSVKEYFTLSEKQREQLWDRWYKESEKEVEEIHGKGLNIVQL